MTVKQLITTIFLVSSITTFAQDKYVIRLTDKNNSPFSIGNPQAFLTQRAIDRRTKQNIPFDNYDLPVNTTYIQGIENTGATILNYSKWLNTVTIQTSTPSVLTAISALPFVLSTTNVARFSSSPSTHQKFEEESIPPILTTSIVARTNSLNYGNGNNQTTMININALHDLNYQGQGMVIAVIDAGFQNMDMMTCFDSIRANNQLLGTWDFVDHETDVYDDNSHGSSVLSTIAANVPGDLVGTAPKANFWLLRSEDAPTEYIIEEYNWASAAEFADSVGADIINSSLGYTEFDDFTQNHTYADMDGNTAPCTIAADRAVSKGILVVNSAGNSGNSPWQYIGAPADGDSVLSIGAVDDMENYAGFSSIGPTADGRIKPDVCAQGQGTFVFTPFGSSSQSANGTSFSSPVIAGAVACLWQAWPNKTNIEIMESVKRSASQYNNPDNNLGYGIPDFGSAFTITGAQFIHANEMNDELIVYPNPFVGNHPLTINIKNHNGQNVQVELVDAMGKSYFKDKFDLPYNGQNELMFYPSMANMGSGLFFLHVKTDDNKYVKRLVKL